ncbi:MAG: hypothetical protein Q7J29_16360 [Stagnimonas sp.]|nr:hypothetical protein [Stagnimonas sp.]
MRPLAPVWQATLDDYPTALAVSRDGALIAAGTASGTLSVFDAASGALLHTLDAHAGGVLALAFGRQQLASAGQDGHARLWDARSGAAIAALPGGSGWVSHLQWTPDGKRLATAAGKTATLWNEQGSVLQKWSASAGINGLAFNAVGGLLAATAGAEVLLWRAADGGLDRTLKWVSTLINAHWSPDGKVLAAGSIDKSVHFWRAGAWLDSKMGGYQKKPQALAWSADSKFLATTGEDAIIVWPFAGKGPEGSKPMQLLHHLRAPEVLAAHPKKPLLLSGSPDKTLVLWDLKAGEAPQGFATLSTAISALAFHPTLPLAFATDADGQLAAYWTDQ